MDAGKPRLGVWLDDGGRESLDLDVLAWAQTGADVAIRPISASLAEPGPGGTDAEVFERFLAEEWDAVVVPESRLDQAAYALVLGPGQEAAWLWPDLHPSFFLERRVLWRDDRRPPAEA